MTLDYTDVVLDLETLGVRPGCVVLSAGIVLFNRNKQSTFEELLTQGVNIIFNTEEQVEQGLVVDQKTLNWWKEQMVDNPVAQCLVQGIDSVHVRDLYSILDGLAPVFAMTAVRWYARGPHFDMAIFEAMLEKFNVTPPWKYWMVRDVRTYIESHGLDPQNVGLPEPEGFVKHNALHDAAMDAMRIQYANSQAVSKAV